MRSEFFKPTWSKLIVLLAVNTVAVFLGVLLYLSVGPAAVSRFAYAFYVILVPFDLLVFKLASGSIVSNLGVVIGIRLFDSVSSLAWHYVIACALVYAYKRSAGAGKQGVIITPKISKKKSARKN
jgi:hypothetical protein